ncbi:hypothetical protein DFH27DRAFT_60494 [Peziza echinospora]|nr:hypothetical protein DFH27DRAFT_60494 [Peziza echinospora]
MSSPQFTQFNAHSHPSHAHRHGSTSSTSSTGSMNVPGVYAGARNTATFQPSTAYHQRRASISNQDPFAAHREPGDDPFASHQSERRTSDGATSQRAMSGSEGNLDRRMSREWDASKVPPSKFQRPEGSIFATPASRDGHIARNKLKAVIHKVKEKTHK